MTRLEFFCLTPLSASATLIWKPVNWFAQQINWLVSIWGQHWHLIKNNNETYLPFLVNRIRVHIHQKGSSHRRCSVRKVVLRNFAKFTGKHQCQCLLYNKVAIKKETLAQVNFAKFLRAPVFYRTAVVAASVKRLLDCQYWKRQLITAFETPRQWLQRQIMKL